MKISIYTEKLNKVDGNVYVIEEEVSLIDGVYGAPLAHDNVNTSTLAVYTGPKLTGDRIQSYALSTPSLMPWKRLIRIYADVPTVYISYETEGDTVEADDVNLLQQDLIRTQEGVNEEEDRAEAEETLLKAEIAEETARATAAEKKLTTDLTAEISRAKEEEKAISDDLVAEQKRANAAEKKVAADLAKEVERATAAEKHLTDSLVEETTRATMAEKVLMDNLAAEVIRAKAGEKAVADNLTVETDRAKTREDEIAAGLAAENSRALNAENALAEDLNVEMIRAKAVEKILTDNLAEETARAGAKETEISSNLSSEITRAKAVEKTLTDNLTTEVTRAKGAEKTLTDNLAAEVTRAKAAEKTNSDSVSAEVSRANEKEAELQGNITVEVSRATAAENDIRSTISTNKPNWDDKYTRNEVDNKFSALETAIDWKEAVATFADLATTYPKPDDGWTVNVKDTDYTYRWSGTTWIAISANAIPKATQSVDGLLSKEDKAALDDTNAKKHTHSNKSTLDKLTETLLTNWTDAYNKRHEHGNKAVIDKITQTLLDNWTAAYTHIGDAVKHITATERANWNDANSKKHTHSNKAVIDKVTQALLDNWSAAYVHISDAVKHITAAERTNWNAAHTHVSNKSNPHGVTAAQAGAAPASHAHSYLPLAGGTMDENKSVGIKARATGNSAQGMWFYNYDDNRYGGIGSMADEGICNRIFIGFGDSPWDQGSSLYITPQDVYFKQNKVWHAGNGGTGSGLDADLLDGNHATAFAKASHTHMKSQITDMPTKVSQFTNDKGYITAADVDTSQNHIHANKSVLDKITQTLLDNWNAAYNHVSDTVKHITVAERTNWNTAHIHVGNKNNPHGVTAAQTGAAPVSHTHIVGQITDFPRTMPADGGNSATVNNHTVNANVPSGAKFTDTTYSAFKAATASAAGGTGLVPAPAAGAQTKYLRADGSWQTPPNTTYGVATQSANGLMAAADKKKLDGVAAGANNYVHPSSHPGSMITQDATHRFTTDTEKAGWNKILFSAAVAVPASGWSTSVPYTQTVSVSGLTAAMDVMLGLNITGSPSAASVAGWKKALGMIDEGTTANGTITFKCYSKKPTVDIPVFIKSV